MTYNKFIEVIKRDDATALVDLMTNIETRLDVANFAYSHETIYDTILVDMSDELFDTFCLWLPLQHSYEEYEVIKKLVTINITNDKRYLKLHSYMTHVADRECSLDALARLYPTHKNLLKLFMDRGYITGHDIKRASINDMLCSDLMFNMLTDNFPMNYTDLLHMKLQYCYSPNEILTKIIESCTAITDAQYQEILSNGSMNDYIIILFKNKVYPSMELFAKYHETIMNNVPWEDIYSFLAQN